MKKAIVIGATSGIGRELANILADNDYKIGITGRRTELLEELKSKNPTHYIIKTLDITDTSSSVNKLDELTTTLGGIDLLILSSGVGNLNTTLDFTIEKKIIETKVHGLHVLPTGLSIILKSKVQVI